jgi:predicted ribonuclease YlaK
MIKFYDTCALLDLQSEIFKSNFYISNITITEIEQIKTSGLRDEETKWKARQLIRLLQDHEGEYDIILYDPKWSYLDEFNLPPGNDSKIVVTAYHCDQTEEILFVTSDIVCQKMAEIVGLNTEFCREAVDDGYTGYKIIRLNDNELADFYSNIQYNNINKYELLTNQYLIIKDKDGKIVDKYKWYQTCYKPVNFIAAESRMFGKITPKDGDICQQFALDSLANNQITMLRGPAGTGKSLLSLGYLFSQLEKGKIDKIIIFCNTVATKGSAKLGFYPGSRTEKLLDSQIGNFLISKLGDRVAVEQMTDNGTLLLLPMSDIRGFDTSGMNAGIYITEAQNLDIELMKLALQRIGDDSICILDGDDSTQVDMSLYAGSNNGMKRVSTVFRGHDFYGEVTLNKIYRSKIAELAQQL